jgi:hypothetical protein
VQVVDVLALAPHEPRVLHALAVRPNFPFSNHVPASSA